MKYIALLRGINVGGNNTVKMSELKEVFKKAGFTNVSTYINSGNVMFESDENDVKWITKEIDIALQKTFFVIKTIVLSYKELEHVLEHIPNNWKGGNLRKYVAFVKNPSKPDDVMREVQLKEGLDFIERGIGVVYMSTKLSGLTKSGFPKLITKKVYQDITTRNYNTVQKLHTLMQQNN